MRQLQITLSALKKIDYESSLGLCKYHRDWRWFDFLWMTHTMDYQTRDDFNTLLLRSFSLLGLITVLSGFVLWGVSSPTIRRFTK
jgi:hypothetical protein